MGKGRKTRLYRVPGGRRILCWVPSPHPSRTNARTQPEDLYIKPHVTHTRHHNGDSDNTAGRGGKLQSHFHSAYVTSFHPTFCSWPPPQRPCGQERESGGLGGSLPPPAGCVAPGSVAPGSLSILLRKTCESRAAVSPLASPPGDSSGPPSPGVLGEMHLT